MSSLILKTLKSKKRQQIAILYILTLIIGTFIPKSKKIIVFTSRRGYYWGNPKALYEYFKKNTKFFSCYYFLNYNEIRYYHGPSDDNVKYMYTISSIFSILRAKTVVLDCDYTDFLGIFLNPLTQNIIQTGHGVPNMKHGFSNIYLSRERAFKYSWEGHSYSAMLSTSDLVSYIFSARWRMDNRKIHITGYPRNDILYCKQEKNKLYDLLEKTYNKLPLFNKVILYAPTWRDCDRRKNDSFEKATTRFFPFDDFDLDELHIFLEKYSSILLLRGHPCNYRFCSLEYHSNRIVRFNPDICDDVQPFLPFADILVTDYSSIYTDFLLCNKPIIFIPHALVDIDSFPLDYNVFTPGYKVKNQKEFLSALKTYLEDSKRHQEERRTIKKLLFKYDDSNSCERVHKLILKLLNS